MKIAELLEDCSSKSIISLFLLYMAQEITLELNELAVAFYVATVRATVYKEIFKSCVLDEYKTKLSEFDTYADSAVDFYSSLLKIGMRSYQIYMIIAAIGTSYFYSFVTGLLIYAVFLSCRTKNIVGKKKIMASAAQIDLIQEAYRSKTILTNHTSKKFLEQRYLGYPEFDQPYIFTESLLYTIGAFGIHTLKAFDMMIGAKNNSSTSFLKSPFLYSDNLLSAFDMVFGKTIEIFEMYHYIPSTFCACIFTKTVLENKEKIYKDVIEDTGLNINIKDISVLTEEIFYFDKSIGFNLNYNKEVYDRKHHLKVHAFRHDFYKLLTEITNISSVNELLKTKTNTLSKGQKKAVCIFRTLVKSAKIYILSDPFDGLDYKYHKRLSLVFDNYNVLLLNQ